MISPALAPIVRVTGALEEFELAAHLEHVGPRTESADGRAALCEVNDLRPSSCRAS